MKTMIDNRIANRTFHAVRGAALAAWVCCSAQAQATVVNVSDMIAAQWTQIGISAAGIHATLEITNPAIGGNTGSYWQNTFDLANRNVGLNHFRRAVVFNGAAYNPATDGALANLTFQFDTMRLFASSGSSAGFLLPLLEQSGRFFTRPIDATAVTLPAWQTQTFTSSLATDWVELDTLATPDFSAGGNPLHFGYIVSIGTRCLSVRCRGGAFISGLDNFRVEALAAVTVNQVPEPSSLGLTVLSLAMLALGRRRSKASKGLAFRSARTTQRSLN